MICETLQRLQSAEQRVESLEVAQSMLRKSQQSMEEKNTKQASQVARAEEAAWSDGQEFHACAQKRCQEALEATQSALQKDIRRLDEDIAAMQFRIDAAVDVESPRRLLLADAQKWYQEVLEVTQSALREDICRLAEENATERFRLAAAVDAEPPHRSLELPLPIQIGIHPRHPWTLRGLQMLCRLVHHRSLYRWLEWAPHCSRPKGAGLSAELA